MAKMAELYFIFGMTGQSDGRAYHDRCRIRLEPRRVGIPRHFVQK
jgi:hypothetical protein